MRKAAFSLLALALACPSWAGGNKSTKKSPAPAKSASNPFGCSRDEFVGKYKDPDVGVMFSFWHPVEIELFLKDSFYKDTPDEAYFKGDFAKANHDNALLVAKKDPAGTTKSAALTLEMRKRIQGEAAAARAAGARVSDQADPPLLLSRFIDCRMELAGKSDEFKRQKQVQTSPDERKAFWRYWRAFMGSELQMYINESGKLAAGQPVGYEKVLFDLTERTKTALAGNDAKYRKDMFANAGMSDTDAPEQPETKPSTAKSPFPEKGSAGMLSAAEARYFPENEQKEYLTKLVGLKDNPAWKQGDKDDGSKEALTGQMRYNLNNLSADGYKYFGADAAAIKAKIEKEPFGSESRMKMAEGYRKAAIAYTTNGKKLPPGFANDQALAKYLAEHPEQSECLWAKNCNGGSVAGPPSKVAKGDGKGDGKDKPGAPPEEKQPEDVKNEKTTKPDIAPPSPGGDHVDAKKEDNTFKKELPAIGNGLRMGAYGALLGLFLGGPAGVLLFGCMGLIGGYGLTKLNKMMGD